MEINVVATDAFSHKSEWGYNVHQVLPHEGAQYVLKICCEEETCWKYRKHKIKRKYNQIHKRATIIEHTAEYTNTTSCTEQNRNE